jgi:hypothetical protein
MQISFNLVGAFGVTKRKNGKQAGRFPTVMKRMEMRLVIGGTQGNFILLKKKVGLLR